MWFSKLAKYAYYCEYKVVTDTIMKRASILYTVIKLEQPSEHKKLHKYPKKIIGLNSQSFTYENPLEVFDMLFFPYQAPQPNSQQGVSQILAEIQIFFLKFNLSSHLTFTNYTPSWVVNLEALDFFFTTSTNSFYTFITLTRW